jgi:hypothetical protein
MAVTALINPWNGFVKHDDDAPKNSEARIALENTLIKACDRLDKILEDDRRWSLEYQMNLEAEFHKSHAQNLNLLESQATAAAEVASPHFQYRPRIAKSQDGTVWMAILGDENDISRCIIGLGRTPEEALAEFDKKFQGKELSPEVDAFLKQRQENYGQETVDTNGQEQAGQVAGGENANQQDSGNIEPARGISQGTNAPFGPTRPGYAKSVATGLPQARGGGEETRTSFVRKIAAFCRRFWGVGKTRGSR